VPFMPGVGMLSVVSMSVIGKSGAASLNDSLPLQQKIILLTPVYPLMGLYSKLRPLYPCPQILA